MNSERPAAPDLPSGLDPVTAGRLGLWLLGKRSHRARLRRRASVPREGRRTLIGRFAHLVLPWRVYEYPGERRAIAEWCGVGVGTARNWLRCGDDRLPAVHARTLAALCRTRAEEFALLAEDLERHAAGAPRVGKYRRDRPVV